MALVCLEVKLSRGYMRCTTMDAPVLQTRGNIPKKFWGAVKTFPPGQISVGFHSITLYNSRVALGQNLAFSKFVDDDELLLWYVWSKKVVKPYFQLEPFLKILTIANLRHVIRRMQNLSSGLVEWSCAVVKTIAPPCQVLDLAPHWLDYQCCNLATQC